MFCYPHGIGVFLQANCTSHKSRLATGWQDGHYSEFSVIHWSLRSPNLNPIEHLCDVLKQAVKGYHTEPTNLIELRIALNNIWQVIPVERFQKLVESMPCRVGGQRRLNSLFGSYPFDNLVYMYKHSITTKNTHQERVIQYRQKLVDRKILYKIQND
ncbi:transposable element Tcb2 transposase [Trichonephila clavipes]|nr:transposable element Tcb2 transposase [Trichonephila clavipes]